MSTDSTYLPGIVKYFREWVGRSIGHRFIVWSVSFWIISVLVLALVMWQVGQTQVLSESRQRNVQLASVISRDVNAKIGAILSELRAFSRHLELLSPDLDSQSSAILAQRLAAPNRLRAVYYFDNSDRLLLHVSDPLAGLQLLRSAAEIVSRPPIQPAEEVSAAYRMTNSVGTHLSDVTFSGLDRIPVFYVGTRLTFPDGAARVVVVEVDLRDVWQRIDLSMVGQSGFAYAVSREGVLIAHPDPALLGRRMPQELASLTRGYEGSTTYVDPARHGPVVAAYSPVGGSTDWGIVIQQDEAELNAVVLNMGISVIGISVALAILGTLGILFLIRNLTEPIVELTKITQGIAHTGRLTKTITEHQSDEIGQLSRAFDQMIERLQTSEGRVATAAAEERNRLARDLHDAVTQTLFAATLIADVLPVLWKRKPEEGLKRLEELRQLTRGALAEMRMMLLELRPATLDEAQLEYLLRQLAESITGRSRVPVTVVVEGPCSLPVEVKVALYRIAQESLNNMAKHAQAKQAIINLHSEPERVILRVTDDGNGFDPASIRPDSLGLGIMRERARSIGVRLSIESEISQGTSIEAIWNRGSNAEAL
ncbi:MAG: histidine kinase [Chloroflexota bacterium]